MVSITSPGKLNQLTDVVISNPIDGDILVYDSTNSVKWKNSIQWPWAEVETDRAGDHSRGVHYGTKEFKTFLTKLDMRYLDQYEKSFLSYDS